MNNKTTMQSRILKKKRKRRLRKRTFLLIFIPIALVLMSAIGYGAYLYAKANSVLSNSFEDDGREKSALREVEIDPSIDNVSILIMGVDENEHRNQKEDKGPTRTDALMLATFNKEEKSVKIASIPRDSYVYIPEVDRYDKINHAHAYGGVLSTIETVEHLLEVPVDYYVKLNFHAVVDVIDALGGITMDVPYEFTESNSMDKRDAIHLMPGEQVLNGEEALALARTRKLDNDIERGKRQQEIIKAAAKKAMSVGSVLNYDDLIQAVGDNMTTNMKFNELSTFFVYGTSGPNLDIETYTLEGHDYQPGPVYYWQLDEVALNETKTKLQSHLDLPIAEDPLDETLNAAGEEAY